MELTVSPRHDSTKSRRSTKVLPGTVGGIGKLHTLVLYAICGSDAQDTSMWC